MFALEFYDRFSRLFSEEASRLTGEQSLCLQFPLEPGDIVISRAKG